jgi:hypothetical protein
VVPVVQSLRVVAADRQTEKARILPGRHDPANDGPPAMNTTNFAARLGVALVNFTAKEELFKEAHFDTLTGLLTVRDLRKAGVLVEITVPDDDCGCCD